MRKYSLIILLLGLLSGELMSQSIFEPNYALKNPISLEIINIETKDDVTLLNISIENLIDGGYYCIDPETYLLADNGGRYKLSEISGLPLCPDIYKFTRVGEIKYVSMKFPPIDADVKWLDIIEECGENCLSIYGLSLDLTLNTEINICFRDIDNGRLDEAMVKFEALKQKLQDSGNPILGSVYLNLISLYEETGNSQKAYELKTEFSGIIIPHKELFMALIK